MTPVHAILNYCCALLEAETRLAISALGMDPGLGLGLHTDTANRDSLVFDVLEPIRPQVETWLLDWIAKEPLRRADFFETATGNCRLMSPMCTHLGKTASAWGKLIAPWAEFVAQTLWAGANSGRIRNSILPTRLTQQRRTEAKGKVWMAAAEPPKADHFCRGCGKKIANGRLNCANCAVDGATERLAVAAKLGRVAAQRPEARAKHVASRKRHAQADSAWDESTQPRLAYQRSVLATNPAASREHSHISNSITNWCLALVCRPNPGRLSPTSEALASIGRIGGCFYSEQVSRKTLAREDVGGIGWAVYGRLMSVIGFARQSSGAILCRTIFHDKTRTMH